VLSLSFLLSYSLSRQLSDAPPSHADDVDEFKWPDLQPDGQLLSTNTSTLKPQETHARGTHGIGDDGEFGSEYGGYGGDVAGDVRASGALYAPAGDGAGAWDARRHSAGGLSAFGGGGGYGSDPYGSASHEASREALAIMDGGSAAFARGYDPYPGGPIHSPQPLGAAMGYPPSPPQYRSAGSSPYHVQEGFGPFGDEHLGASGGSSVSGPQGAPGAAGAVRAQSPLGAGEQPYLAAARSESPFDVPGLSATAPARSSELYDDVDVDEKSGRSSRGPL